MLNRRKFLQLSTLTVPLHSAKNTLTNNNAQTTPIVIAYWPPYNEANNAHWHLVSVHGTDRNATETGARRL